MANTTTRTENTVPVEEESQELLEAAWKTLQSVESYVERPLSAKDDEFIVRQGKAK